LTRGASYPRALNLEDELNPITNRRTHLRDVTAPPCLFIIIMNSSVLMSQQDAHILRALISIQDSVPPADDNLRRALSEVLNHAEPPVSGTPDRETAHAVGINDIITVRSVSDPEPEESTFQVVLPPLSNAAEGKISVFAPMSIGVLGHKRGDLVSIVTPEGPQRVEILHIKKG
jgi:hypothetical protein